MDIEVYQTVTEKDGKISAYIRFKDEITGKILKETCVQGKTTADFETKINDAKSKLESLTVSKTAGLSIVTEAISNIKKGN